jgi:hypothetical protein
MRETELETSRITTDSRNIKKMEEIEKWFRYEYPARFHKIERHRYLGLPLPETRYALELEAYNKENELRLLKGEEPLPALKLNNLL